jgi:hypothetical protein
MFPSSIRNAKREIKPTYTETIMEIQAVTLVFKLEITIMEIYVVTIVLNRKYNALLYITFYVQFVSSFFSYRQNFSSSTESFFFFFNFLYLDILSAFKKWNIGILDSTCWKWGCNMLFFFFFLQPNRRVNVSHALAFARKIWSCSN